MITRQGRSASTVSIVLPNTEVPAIRCGSAITTAVARMSCASSMIRRPAWPARTFSQCPETRPPPCSLACSMIVSAADSASDIGASIGSALGTMIVTSTWIPRRRRAASLTAVAIVCSS